MTNNIYLLKLAEMCEKSEKNEMKNLKEDAEKDNRVLAKHTKNDEKEMKEYTKTLKGLKGKVSELVKEEKKEHSKEAGNKYLDKIAASYPVHAPALRYLQSGGSSMNLTGPEFKKFIKDKENYIDGNVGKRHGIAVLGGAALGGAVGAITGRSLADKVTGGVLGTLAGGLITGAGVTRHINRKAHNSAVKDILKKDLALSKKDLDIIRDHFAPYYDEK